MHAVKPWRILLMWLVLLILLGGMSGVSRPLNHAWVYDALRRLTEEGIETGSAGPVGAVQYGPIVSGNTQSGGYDRVGNRQNREVAGETLVAAGVTQVMNFFNVLDQPCASPLAFDAAGNTTSDGTGAMYDYDSDNRLIRKFVDAQNKVEFQYDADGNRVKKTVTANGVQNIVLYLVDDRNPTGYAQVMEELPATGTTPVVTYVCGLDLISQTRGGQTRYYGYDGLGSVRYLSDANGTVTDTFTYDAFGILIDRRARNASGTLVAFANPALETPPAGTSPVINNYRYTGEQWDSDLGMYYLRARYYKPEIGRFWTMDSYEGSSEDPLSLHKYLYCQNNPVNLVDPSGHEGELGSLMAAATTFGYMAANVGIRVIPTINRVTIMLYEGVSGSTVVGGAGLLAGGKLTMTIVGGGTKIIDPIAKAQTERIALVGFAEAGKYGVWPFKVLAKLIPSGSGLQKHHLVEQRFANTLGVAADEIPSIALTVAEHSKYTARWLEEIGRRNMDVPITTRNATIDNIWDAAQEVYHDAPELLEFVKTFLNK